MVVWRCSQERALSMWLLLLLALVAAGPSQRGKCALECYSKCMQSGTPTSSQCNCPMMKNPGRCSTVENQLLKADIVEAIPEVKSDYLDSHTIRLQMSPWPTAFAYIFEYSTISTQPDDWYFAGASSTPTITFSVLDPCRDYQFRVLVVVRSTIPDDTFVVFRPRAIPVHLPPFSLNQNQISVEIPSRNSSQSDTLKVYVRWTLPKGYSDGDIYGYEAPALYPIQCHTPEEELPQPKIEIMRSGGRLAITLPSSVLDARCRLWAEVRMLPRCVRLEPHSVQKNIEIDCEKTPSLEICSKDINPVCSEVVDIGGEKGKAMITWTAPKGDTKPLYYHLRYGPAQMKGSPPFVTWQLATKKDVKVDGKVTTIPVDIPEDQDYGVQVCAIMTQHRKRAKFGLVRVTPFQCTSCNVQSSLSVGSCGHCGVIEGTTVMEKSWNKRPPPRTSVDGEQQEQQVVPQTVFNIGADLTVNQAKEVPAAGGAKIQAVGVKGAAGKDPLSLLPIERAEAINRADEPSTTAPQPHSDAISIPKSTTVMPTTTETTVISVTSMILEEKHPSSTIIEVGADIAPVKMTPLNKTITETFNNVKKEPQVLPPSVETTTVLEVTTSSPINILDSSTTRNNSSTEAPKLLKAEIVNRATVTETADVRAVSPRSNKGKCLLANGVVCENGCLSKTTCICPPETHDLSQNGGCSLKKQTTHQCLSSGILAATWDPVTMNILVRSELASKHLRTAPIRDRLFVEFGKIVDHSILQFTEKYRQKMIVGTEKLVKAGIFSKEPFIFHVNETISIERSSYGMRLCTFDSSVIKDAFQYDWDSAADGEIVAVTQLSTVHFTNDLHGQLDDVYWATVFQVGKVVLLVLLILIMLGLIYLNCTRIRSLYERKRTHYFRPYVVDPQAQMRLAPRLHRFNPSTAGYYDSRGRVI